MNLDNYYERNRERIVILQPNCAARFLKFLDLCWSNKLFFIVPETGGKRSEEDQLLLLTQGRSYQEVELQQKRLGLDTLQMQKMKNLYIQKKNKTGSIITWTILSNHRSGKALDCLPLDPETLILFKDGSKQLTEMELLANSHHIGVFRPASTIKAGDKAHFEAYDLPIVKKEVSPLTQALLDKKAKRLSISSSK